MHDTEETVMSDYMLDKTVKKYKKIIKTGLIDILRWDPFHETFSGQVLKLVADLGEQFLEEKQEKE
ncbi:hypothetical protein EDD11_001769, partial [Mortierella claussenii]